MADILLTHGYFLYEDPKELQIMKPYAPLGILYLCSHLQAKGFDVEVFDTTFSTRAALANRLQEGPPTVLGIYANLMTRANVVEILAAAKSSGWTTLVGGPEPGAYVEQYLEAGADFVVMGEGERTLEELLRVLQKRDYAKLSAVAGIAYSNAEHVVKTAPREQMLCLDEQPWPARSEVNIRQYIDVWRNHHGMGSVNVITARGCPYRCNWCSHQVYGNTHRRRNPVAVVDEVEWLLSEYEPDMIWISDDVFTIHHGWIREYAAEMKRRGLRIPFECISRADRLNEEMVGLLSDLGCFRVWIGSESGSQRILDEMDRGVKLDQVRKAIAYTRDHGIQSGMFVMWGYEGEEIEHIEETVRHITETNPDIFFTTVSYPIKGTPYYERVKDRLVQLAPWSGSSDREIKIQGRHSRRFYGFADKLLRSEVALSRLKSGTTETAKTSQQLDVEIATARAGLWAAAVEVEA